MSAIGIIECSECDEEKEFDLSDAEQSEKYHEELALSQENGDYYMCAECRSKEDDAYCNYDCDNCDDNDDGDCVRNLI